MTSLYYDFFYVNTSLSISTQTFDLLGQAVMDGEFRGDSLSLVLNSLHDSPRRCTQTKKPTVGVLLIQLGTPRSPSLPSVAHYLNEFLMDKRVIDLPWIARQALVKGFILPFRSFKTQAAYKAIWTAQGSPLLVNSLALRNALEAALPIEGYKVAIGMRYGKPSLAQAIQQLIHPDCERLDVIPLYPQYATSTTGSALGEVFRQLRKSWDIPSLRIQPPFYNQPFFIKIYAQHIQTHLNTHVVEHIIFSYHGLPERHIRKSGCENIPSCEEPSCFYGKKSNTNLIFSLNSNTKPLCYRAQCIATTYYLCQMLSWDQQKTTLAFQSRLGRLTWLSPDVQSILPRLRQAGIRDIAVVCPSFVSDCLETLEEINLRLRKRWYALGGRHFSLVESLNANPAWVTFLKNQIMSNF